MRRLLPPEAASSAIALVSPSLVRGALIEVRPTVLRARLAGARLGDVVSVGGKLRAQVVAVCEQTVLLAAYGGTNGLYVGAEVELRRAPLPLALGEYLRGAVIDALGEVLEGEAPSGCPTVRESALPPALARLPLTERFVTGVRVLDAFTPCAVGQRLCVFAEAGVGKSSLLSAILQHSAADINVVALVGERGREVTELIRLRLNPAARAKSVLVVSTSDEPALRRVAAVNTALCIAEYFRDQGCAVLLQIDSLTRLFRAYRELGFAAGEPPVRRGYPATVFAELPRLIERMGRTAGGSITGFLTVLTSGDLDEDPLVEEIRGLTDGHIVLSRELAESGHYPPVDVLRSLSRVQGMIADSASRDAARTLRAVLARLERDRDLVQFGAAGDEQLKRALEIEPEIRRFQQQSAEECAQFAATREWLIELGERIGRSGTTPPGSSS